MGCTFSKQNTASVAEPEELAENRRLSLSRNDSDLKVVKRNTLDSQLKSGSGQPPQQQLQQRRPESMARHPLHPPQSPQPTTNNARPVSVSPKKPIPINMSGGAVNRGEGGSVSPRNSRTLSPRHTPTNVLDPDLSAEQRHSDPERLSLSPNGPDGNPEHESNRKKHYDEIAKTAARGSRSGRGGGSILGVRGRGGHVRKKSFDRMPLERSGSDLEQRDSDSDLRASFDDDYSASSGSVGQQRHGTGSNANSRRGTPLDGIDLSTSSSASAPQPVRASSQMAVDALRASSPRGSERDGSSGHAFGTDTHLTPSLATSSTSSGSIGSGYTGIADPAVSSSSSRKPPLSVVPPSQSQSQSSQPSPKTPERTPLHAPQTPPGRQNSGLSYSDSERQSGRDTEQGSKKDSTEEGTEESEEDGSSKPEKKPFFSFQKDMARPTKQRSESEVQHEQDKLRHFSQLGRATLVNNNVETPGTPGRGNMHRTASTSILASRTTPGRGRMGGKTMSASGAMPDHPHTAGGPGTTPGGPGSTPGGLSAQRAAAAASAQQTHALAQLAQQTHDQPVSPPARPQSLPSKASPVIVPPPLPLSNSADTADLAAVPSLSVSASKGGSHSSSTTATTSPAISPAASPAKPSMGIAVRGGAGPAPGSLPPAPLARPSAFGAPSSASTATTSTASSSSAATTSTPVGIASLRSPSSTTSSATTTPASSTVSASRPLPSSFVSVSRGNGSTTSTTSSSTPSSSAVRLHMPLDTVHEEKEKDKESRASSASPSASLSPSGSAGSSPSTTATDLRGSANPSPGPVAQARSVFQSRSGNTSPAPPRPVSTTAATSSSSGSSLSGGSSGASVSVGSAYRNSIAANGSGSSTTTSSSIGVAQKKEFASSTSTSSAAKPPSILAPTNPASELKISPRGEVSPRDAPVSPASAGGNDNNGKPKIVLNRGGLVAQMSSRFSKPGPAPGPATATTSTPAAAPISEEEKHESDKLKHFQRLGSATLVHQQSASSGKDGTFPPSPLGRNNSNAFTRGGPGRFGAGRGSFGKPPGDTA